VTHGVVGVAVVGGANDFILRADGTVDVTEQSERKLLRFGEREVLGRTVEGCTEDDCIRFVETVGTVTQALTLLRSTRCRRLGIPPQQHPPTSEIGEMHPLTVLIREVEVGSDAVQLEHGHIFARLTGSVSA